MTNLYNFILCITSSALLLSACGPALEGEESEASALKKPKTSGPTTPAADEPRTVSQMTFVRDLGSALGIPVATYLNTCTASNQWTTTCGNGSSRDISYLWTVPQTGSYRFSTVGSNFDTVLEIRNYNATTQVLGCNDDATDKLESRISFPSLTAGTRLLITIEGYAGECGVARLNIAEN
jgi:hypothetical protein